MFLTIHSVHFYGSRLVCSRPTTDDGIVVRYLYVHGRVLLKNSIKMAEELRASIHGNGQQSGIMVFLLQRLFELQLRDGQDGGCALSIIGLRHGVNGRETAAM
jgi:hypothetical protein